MHLLQIGFSLIFVAVISQSLGKRQKKEAVTQFLMVVGGVYRAGLPTSNDVELLSLDSDVEVPECLQNLNGHPRRLHWACPALLTTGMRWHLDNFTELRFFKHYYA